MMPAEPVSKRNRFFKNSIYGMLSWVLPMLPTMIATPIVLDRIGKEQYGVLVVIIGFISYFFTTAIGKVAGKYVAEYKSSGETEKISSVVSATIILGVAITILGASFTVFFSRYIVVEILLIPIGLQNEAVIGLYLACATILSIVIGQVFQLVLQGLQRFDRFLLLANLSSVSFSLGSIAIVLAGYGIVILLWWNLITWVFVCILSYWAASRLLPEYKFTFHISRDTWQAVGSYAASIIAYQFCGNVLLLFERGWIMRSFGPEALTFYAIPMVLAMYLHLFTASLVLAMFPALNELLSKPAKLKELYQKATKLVLAILAFAVLSVVIGGEMFLRLWLGAEYADASYLLLVIHIATFAILALSTIAWQVAESFRAAAINAGATAVWMLVGGSLMILLSVDLQTTGVALGRLTGVLVFIPLIIYVEQRFIGGIDGRFWLIISARVLVAAIPAAIVEWSLVSVLSDGWLSFLAAMGTGAFAYLAALLLIGYFDESEKQMFKVLLAKYR